MITKFGNVTTKQLAELVEFSKSPEARFLIGDRVNNQWKGKLREDLSLTVPAISFREAKLSGQDGFDPLLSITLVVAEKHWIDTGHRGDSSERYGYYFKQRDIPRTVIDRIYEILGRYPQAEAGS